MPYLDEGAIPKQAHVARAAALRVTLISLRIDHIDGHLDGALSNSGGGRAAGHRQLHNRLATILPGNVERNLRSFTRKNIGQQSGIIELVEEQLDRRYVESLLVVTPENLVPRNRSSIEQTLWGDNHPFRAIIERNQRQQMLA